MFLLAGVAFGVAGWLFAQWIHARSEPPLPCEAERMRW